MAKREIQELSPESEARITRSVRSLAEDRVERGVDIARPFRCDNCGEVKSGAGSAKYGEYKLCNDCLLDFTVALATNRTSGISEYMRRDTGDALPPTDWNEGRVQTNVPGPVANREQLLPRNEPLG